MTRSAEIRQLLAFAPSTCTEISAILDISLRRAHVGMWVLTHLGQAVKTGETVESEYVDCPTRGGRKRLNLYELTPLGLSLCPSRDIILREMELRIIRCKNPTCKHRWAARSEKPKRCPRCQRLIKKGK